MKKYAIIKSPVFKPFLNAKNKDGLRHNDWCKDKIKTDFATSRIAKKIIDCFEYIGKYIESS